MNVILARHGNTFEVSDSPIVIGSQNDLPLVARGVEQARHLAVWIGKTYGIPSAVYCGPLKRTCSYAEHILKQWHLPIPLHIDVRLNELDYGNWSGLTPREICERFGESDWSAWQEFGKWPQAAGWGSSEWKVLQEVKSFADEIVDLSVSDDFVLVVTSQGRLRYFQELTTDPRDLRQGRWKVNPGHYCYLKHLQAGWSVQAWNQKPEV